jgi:hypothetical protein
MRNEFLTIYSEDELKHLVIESLKEYEAQKASTPSVGKTFSINQAAKMLHRSHSKVKNLITEGFLKTTSDERRVTAISVDEYLKNLK